MMLVQICRNIWLWYFFHWLIVRCGITCCCPSTTFVVVEVIAFRSIKQTLRNHHRPQQPQPQRQQQQWVQLQRHVSTKFTVHHHHHRHDRNRSLIRSLSQNNINNNNNNNDDDDDERKNDTTTRQSQQQQQQQEVLDDELSNFLWKIEQQQQQLSSGSNGGGGTSSDLPIPWFTSIVIMIGSLYVTGYGIYVGLYGFPPEGGDNTSSWASSLPRIF